MIGRVRVLFLVLLISLGVQLAQPVMYAQSSTEAFSPGVLASEIRSQLFAVQDALNDGDQSAAQLSMDAASLSIESLAAMQVADPTATSDLLAGRDAALAATSINDPVALAAARGTIWTAMLRGSYAETVLAIEQGRTDDAAEWLLLREFRPTTKFERPNSNATLAIRNLMAGEVTIDEAVHEVDADLLDTYQAKFTTALTDLNAAVDLEFPAVQAEQVNLIAGYWQVLQPAYINQLGQPAAEDVDLLLARLSEAVASQNDTETIAVIEELITVDRSFRAAPLSEADQARRAGQLVRYLSLVPVEYGRGVRDGEVVVDIEIGEATAFLEGARASFDDLYLTLQAQDPVNTAEVDATISWLEDAVSDASQHSAVADPAEVRTQSESAMSILEEMFPEEWTRSGGQADFDVISSLLDQMENAMRAGQPDLAESARLEAYAIYELGAEKRLLAFAPDLANRTEALFWGGLGDTEGLAVAISRGASPAQMHESRMALDNALEESQVRIGAGRPSNAVVIFNAATIVFREGLEAVLILASLVASMIGANQKFKKPLVLGAGLAFLATALLFWAAQTVLHSLGRYGEKLEAVISLIAIGVLLIVMNWFFHKVYWTKWISKHHAQRRAVLGGAISGQILGLVILGFTSVFREGAETVLFLQALVLDAGTWVVIQGTLLGLLGTAIVGAMVLVMQKKLPHKKMLTVTGVMLAFVLVVMVGNTVHVFQVVGWLSITPIQGVVFPLWAGTWFGLFATWEGIAFQVLAVIIVIGSYVASEWTTRARFHREMVAAGLAT